MKSISYVTNGRQLGWKGHGGFAWLLFSFLSLCPLVARPADSADRVTPAHLVDINAESGEGTLFKGAALPFGMIMWGPNARAGQGASGYSLTCLSGAEMPGDYYKFVTLTPTVRPLTEAANATNYSGIPRSVSGAPGYCRSQIPNDVLVELTTTIRAGMGRFTVPAGKNLNVLISATEVHFDPHHSRLVGAHRIGKRTVYFAAEFDRPFAEYGVIENGVPLSGKTTTPPPASCGSCYVGFRPGETSEPIQIRLAMSYVSTQNALDNLESEIQGWDFENIRARALAAWNAKLSLIEIDKGAEAARKLFYTCLYRVFLQPNTFNDGNGEYLGFDRQVHRAVNRTQYANYSIWDIYRTWVELVAFLQPKETSDMMQSLVEDARECGGSMPRWPVGNLDTGTMEEGSATPLLCSAFAFGATNFDVGAAFAIMDRTESEPGIRCQGIEAHEGLADFLNLGYVPLGPGWNMSRSASFTLEYATTDFTLAQLAKTLGKPERYEFYLQHAANWTNLYDTSSRYLHARRRDGSWLMNPGEPASGGGFTEGNATQFTWTIRHNMRAMVDLVGGKAAAIARLDALCREFNAGPQKPFLWIGNEPSFGIPWAYDWAGCPGRTDELVHHILTEIWQPGTTPGADDLGALSAWFVWASLGLYPAIPGIGGWTVNSPLFDLATVRLPDGRRLRLHALRSDPRSIYVQALTVNGKPWPATWIPSSLMNAPLPEVVFILASQPGSTWGTKETDSPPSFP